MKKPAQPFLVKNGRKTVYRGTRSACMSKYGWAIGADNGVTLQRNPRFPWTDRETDKRRKRK